MRILVVDDEPDLVTALERGLKREGYAVDTATSGEEALAKASWNSYDLVCLDLNMPEQRKKKVFNHLYEEYRITHEMYKDINHFIKGIREGDLRGFNKHYTGP